MSKGFVLLAIVCIMFAGVFHMLFTMFDYGFFNPDNGAFTKLREITDETLTGDHKERADANMDMLRQFFGMGRFALIGICLVFLVVGALDHKPEGG